MNSHRSPLTSLVLVAPLVVLWALPACPQQPPAEVQTEGKNLGDYNVRQSVEFGWRGTNFTGNQAVYDTFVNLQQGPRLFGQTLEMHSLDHHGLLFDDLFTTSYGYGGDPNNVTVLRISKNKWYDFNGEFRRDRNVWDYDLLANPLNPTTSVPTVIITTSPHTMELSRNLTNLDLTLLPQSSVRFRLGYSRNSNYGPSFTSVHEGTDAGLFQDWKTTLDSYRIGVDFKVLPRTNFSYDQFLNYYKGDSSQGDQNQTYVLPNGTLVDLGLPFDTVNRSPCATPVIDFTTTPQTANPKCNGYVSYVRSGPVRTSYPTEQFTFQSQYFKNVDFAGHVSYSSADSNINNFNELFSGLVTRSNQGAFANTGAAAIKETTVTTDAAVTWYVTPKFRIIDEFRFNYFRIPGQASLTSNSLFTTSMVIPPVVFDPAACPPPFTAKTCPAHNASSPADVSTTVSSLFLGQDAKINTLLFQYDFTKRFGARLGYEYRHRTIFQSDVELTDGLFYPGTAPGVTPPVNAARGACANGPFNADGTCTASTSAEDSSQITINENSLLFGFWARPTNGFRLTYDQELMYADNTFTRISPRQLQHYKFRTSYKPKPWASLFGTLNIYEARNNVSQIDHLEHNRNYGFGVSIAPEEKWSLDFGYNYQGIFSQTNICFVFGSGPPPPGFSLCTIPGSPVPLQAISFYNSKINYGYVDFTVKPIKRVTLTGGYALDSVTGSTLILNPNSPSGPLDFNYHRPYGNVVIDLGKGVAFKTAWGFYDYNEKDSSTDLTGPRSFRGNLVNLSVIYSF